MHIGRRYRSLWVRFGGLLLRCRHLCSPARHVLLEVMHDGASQEQPEIQGAPNERHKGYRAASHSHPGDGEFEVPVKTAAGCQPCREQQKTASDESNCSEPGKQLYHRVASTESFVESAFHSKMDHKWRQAFEAAAHTVDGGKMALTARRRTGAAKLRQSSVLSALKQCDDADWRVAERQP